MPPTHRPDPGADPAIYFGSQLREFRQIVGLSQQDLGSKTGYHGSYISHVERGERIPDLDFVRTCDEVLGTSGALERMWPLVARDAHPAWFRDWVRVETQATGLRTFQITLVPGLLQTASYARELIRYGEAGIAADRVEELVSARIQRQSILCEDDGPELFVVLDHGVLTRRIGSDTIMAEQLKRLVEAAAHPRITLQVVPPDTTAYPGLTGAFMIASFARGPDALYVDTVLAGQVMHGGREVDQANKIFNAIRSEALPVRQSVELIERLEEQWISTT